MSAAPQHRRGEVTRHALCRSLTCGKGGDGKTQMFIYRLIVGVIANMAIFGTLLFLPAGTLYWWRAWAFLGVVFVSTMATMLAVFANNKGLLDERFKSPIQKGQPLEDKILLMMFIATFLGLIVFISLDVFRLHLLEKPGPIVSSLGLVLFVAGWWIISLSFRDNAFAAPVVKHQKERHQTVIDTGVYGVVRHPMYAGAVLLLIGMPLWLESYAAASLASVPIAILALRIHIEEEFLRRELEGYDVYTKRVRYRLIPFLW
jgi:protein-S-isoprenylcysteine O-methyltransferase Ste14